MISLFGWTRASHHFHHSEALGTQQVSGRLGTFPWPPWSSYNYGKGEWGFFWGLRIFSVLPFVSLSFLKLSWSLLLLMAYHQSEMNLICLYFVNSLQS